MSVEENKVVARRFIEEVINGQNLDAMDEFVTPDIVDHSAPPGVPAGIKGVKQVLTVNLAAAPDWHITIEDMIAEGDKVAGR